MSGAAGRRRAVLPEAAHARALAAVVRAQYFPELDALEAAAALAARRAAGDGPGAAAVRRAARALREHRAQEAEREGEGERTTDAAGLRRAPRPLHMETLTGFHERVVSEDNAEFGRVQEEEKKVREKQIQSYLLLTNEPPDKPTIAHQRHHPLVDSPLPLASDLYDPAPNLPASSSQKAPIENTFFFVPTGGEKRPTTHEAATKLLMPPPSSRTGGSRHALVEYIPRNHQERMIQPEATRFPPKRPIVVRKPHLEESSDDGASYESSTDASTDLDAPALPLAVELQRAKKRKHRELQTYIPMTPLVAPSASPITTWGRVDATPMALSLKERDECDSAKGSGSVSYCLPAPSSREAAAAKALATLEERQRLARSVSRARSSSKSPAVATSRGPSVSARSSASFGTTLRASYARPSFTSNRLDSLRSRDHAFNATPQLPENRPTQGEMKNITDDLLHLSK